MNIIQLNMRNAAVYILLVNFPLILIAVAFCLTPFVTVLFNKVVYGEEMFPGAAYRIIFGCMGAMILIINTPLHVPVPVTRMVSEDDKSDYMYRSMVYISLSFVTLTVAAG